MKRPLALILSLALVLSLTATALAATAQVNIAVADSGPLAYATPYAYDEDDGVLLPLTELYPGGNIPYGETIFYPLRGMQTAESSITVDPDAAYVYESDAVRNLKLKTSWNTGSSYVSSVTLVKKKMGDSALTALGISQSTRAYAYFIAVTMKTSSTTNLGYVSGTVSATKAAYGNAPRLTSDVNFIDLDLEIAYEKAEMDEAITKTPKWYDAGYSFDDTSDETEFPIVDSDIGYFTVSTVGQGDLILAASTGYDSTVAARYPQANLDFVKGNGASFNKTGTMTLYAAEGSYLYQIGSDASITAVNATYDEYEEAFTFKTRTLSSYIISDTELDTSLSADTTAGDGTAEDEIQVDDTTGSDGTITPVVPVLPANPATGSRL